MRYLLFLVLPLTLLASDFYVPTTVSKEAQAAIKSFTFEVRNVVMPDADDIKGWQYAYEANEKALKASSDAIVKKLGATLKHYRLGGVKVIEIQPKHYRDNSKVLIYVHGGGYTFFSAYSTLQSAVPVADETGLKVVAVDYTLAPKSKWQSTTNEIVSVIKALKKSGYELKDIAIYGDSAGGGLAAGAVLRARDEGVGLLGAVVLWSPWADITQTGDTYNTLQAASPLLYYPHNLKNCADAYADEKDQKHPYVSPVYADYAKGFPPTLIQVGSKEVFLSNAIRQYRALKSAGKDVEIDPYEGMWHVFQAFHWELPESYLARKIMALFLEKKLGSRI